MISVTGRLAIKRNKYHIVATFYLQNERKERWKSTGYELKGNKKRAEALIDDFVDEVKKEVESSLKAKNSTTQIEFVCFMRKWLDIVKYNIEESTYGGYQSQINSRISEFFKPLDIKIQDLQAFQIQEFYHYLKEQGLSGNTVHRYYSIIRKALNYAVKMDIIVSNPSLKVDPPKKNKFIGSYYSSKEMEQLFKHIANTSFELPILLAAFYGLRRSEVLGLKIDAVDFDEKTITIRHIVTESTINNKRQIIVKDSTKTKSSYRTLPLVNVIEESILNAIQQQKEYQIICGNDYNYDYQDYLCKDEFGNRFKPGYISKKFKKILIENELRIIRFHDLRHSCASLLIAEDIPLKDIQEWLGHSTLSTTADIYVHLDSKRKISSANKLANKLNTSMFSNSNSI
ncbi:tyrosine-type recombinase/integrase [Carnobacterium maltaromaticum]|uniref:tyrosine-type recombinase/integrase n=1 Tax=Carnobacterium maltaromaticum TaxID=2751 RepID=UPI00165A9226|nr:site-specific integrase [Carnobacterium maltaromaticum]MBC9810718.1 tyrosine-type recombinase/integrase [Carnobacterium maltaromaticum]